ncbi:VWA domain-containing protein [Actinomycetospora sp. CA-084318]|uniref:VWA domain-containing protein n=1 Tax=Actinomycetospora sp. CA-084318 TaxID=3239892 RepID=UPI003D978DFA
MTRRSALAAVLGTALLLGVQFLGLGAAAAQSAPTAPDTADAAVQRFTGCVNGQGHGDVVVLVDESGSLAQTDPQFERLVAAKYFLSQLGAQADHNGKQIDVLVDSFSKDFDIITDGWTPLNATTLPGIQGAVDQLRARPLGPDTDYWTALENTRRQLGDRAQAAPAGTTPCQAVVWFSDGKLDYQVRDTPSLRGAYGATSTASYAPGADLTTQNGVNGVIGAAETKICTDGGLADQLRSAGITTFAIGLSAPGEEPPPDFGLMQSIATGGGGPHCGNLPATGGFTQAANVNDLLFSFDQYLTPGQPVENALTHSFVLDRSVDGVHVLAGIDQPTPGSAVRAELVGPGGTSPFLFDDHSGATRTAYIGTGPQPLQVTYSWPSASAVTFDLVDSPQGAANWSGAWTLRFVDPQLGSGPAPSRSSIHVWGDLQPTFAPRGDSTLRSGSGPVALSYGITRRGAPVDPTTLPGAITLSAQLVEPNGTLVSAGGAADKTGFSTPSQVDLSSVPPGPATLRLVLQVTTAPAALPDGRVAGTSLAPTEVDIPVQVAAPVNFPTVAGITFPTGGNGDTELDGSLTVTGPGLVWIEPQKPTLRTVPDGAGSPDLAATEATGPSSAVRLGDGEQGDVPVRLTTGGPATGTASGTVAVSYAPVDHPELAKTVDVPFRADLRKPINGAAYGLAFVLALVLGPLIPLLLLYLVKWLTARIPDQGLQTRRIPVRVVDGGIQRDGVPFALRPEDFVAMTSIPEGGARRLDVGGIGLLTRTGWSPFGRGRVVVDSPGYVASSSTDAEPRGRNGHAVLPLALHDTWILLHAPVGPDDAAEVLVLLHADGLPATRERIAGEIAGRAPAMLERLRSFARDKGLAADGDGTRPPREPEPSWAGATTGQSHPGSSDESRYPNAEGGGYSSNEGGGYGPTAGFGGRGLTSQYDPSSAGLYGPSGFHESSEPAPDRGRPDGPPGEPETDRYGPTGSSPYPSS